MFDRFVWPTPGRVALLATGSLGCVAVTPATVGRVRVTTHAFIPSRCAFDCQRSRDFCLTFGCNPHGSAYPHATLRNQEEESREGRPRGWVAVYGVWCLALELKRRDQIFLHQQFDVCEHVRHRKIMYHY